MSKSAEKLQALQLRREGWSIKEIARKLSVSRSSVSVWCQDIELTPAQHLILREKQIRAGASGRQKGADANRSKRLHSIASAKQSAEKILPRRLSEDQLFFIGLGIYWGEGVKSRNSQTAVVNSDKRIIKLAIKWFVECLGVPRSTLRPYVYIAEAHRERTNVIMAYWQRELGLGLDQFKTPIYITQKTKQQYENPDKYYGVLALRILKGTEVKYKILALLDVIGERLE